MFHFYRAMLCIARTMLSLNVCLSVTRQFCVKTVKHITSPSVSNIILVLCTVSYSPSIVTVAVSVAILENGLTLKSGFGVLQGH